MDNVLPWVQVVLLAFLLGAVLAMVVRGLLFGFDGSGLECGRSAADYDKETPPQSWPLTPGADILPHCAHCLRPVTDEEVQAATQQAIKGRSFAEFELKHVVDEVLKARHRSAEL